MVRKLSDEQEAEILVKLTNGASQSALAREYNVSRTTIANIMKRKQDTWQYLAQKKEENTKSILDHMDEMKGDVCKLLDTMLDYMNDKAKLEKATLNQIATAFGIVIDKFTTREQPKQDNSAKNNLLEALAGIAKPERFDDEV